ncbi:MAG: YhbY family RNA-binding protein [Burkholderiales bacterium]|jgi:putative YhbY family RNA-binding protein|nr:YhbY family RNA-binding protein [Burkholderiales bacterium]
MLTLTPTERRALRAQAHTLSPVVIIGQHGLTPAVLREIDHALNAHELIKVRIFNDERTEREALQLAVCHQLTCAPVQHLGKLIVLWRPASPKAETTPKPPKRPAKKAAKKALPGAINRHGQAIKPLSARQARQQTQQPEWQSPRQLTRQPHDTGRTPFSDRFTDEPTSKHRRSPRSVGHGPSSSPGSRAAGGKPPFQQTKTQTKSAAKPFAKQPLKRTAQQPRGASSTPYSASKQLTGQQPTTRRRLGGRGKA